MRFLEGRSIGLDGVPQQQENYASMSLYLIIAPGGGAESYALHLIVRLRSPLWMTRTVTALRQLDQRAFGRTGAVSGKWLRKPHSSLLYTKRASTPPVRHDPPMS